MEKGGKKCYQEQNTQVLYKRGIYDSNPAEYIEKKVYASCSTGSLKVNYIFVYLEEDEVNACLTSGC